MFFSVYDDTEHEVLDDDDNDQEEETEIKDNATIEKNLLH